MFYLWQCGRQQALDVLHAELFNSTLSPVAVVGGGCSASSEAMAEVTQYYNLSVVCMYVCMYVYCISDVFVCVLQPISRHCSDLHFKSV